VRGMILAAGRGTRMQHLTANTPKPLLQVGGHYLIEYSINALRKAGICEIVINVSYYADQIIAALGDGARYGVALHYSYEKEPLETGGGILQALPYLGHEPFIVLSADVISDYPLKQLFLRPGQLAHLVLVQNPPYHVQGDFALQNECISIETVNPFTFANIGLYHPALFAECRPGKFRLGELLKEAAKNRLITGECFQGLWHNLGRMDDLVSAEQDTRLSCLV
jgi:N-acetyl-alpha-D-muramate 1-phosphate uridylyltransferase